MASESKYAKNLWKSSPPERTDHVKYVKGLGHSLNFDQGLLYFDESKSLLKSHDCNQTKSLQILREENYF